MAERRLHQVDRRAAIERVTGVHMPKPMGRHFLWQARTFRRRARIPALRPGIYKK